ncbi:MAG: NADH-quinone oxidoreductase subunit L [Chloroflexota bacterium]|nr:MAG: NADH-quinone oxidoreductase subunit L [Chloroflexota bacterium]
MTIDQVIWLIPLPPLLAFFLIVLFTNRIKVLSHTIAVSAALLSWVGSMWVFFQALRVEHLGEEPFGGNPINWLPTGSTWFQVGVLVDPLTAVTLFFVAWTVLMIFVYSVGYHNFGQPAGDHDRKGLPPHGAAVVEHGHKHVVPSVEPMYSRFFAFISLFAFGMYILVVSDNLLTLFVGWEIMGLCSYLLIGFWYAKPSARDAAVKAFLTTRVGDVFMLLGIAYLYSATGTLSYREIFSEETLALLASTPALGNFMGLSAAGLIGLLLFIGTVGKSAQFPLHVWLPDAMEGPTPVSAMIHAATMVSAGVYMVIRTFPLLSAGWAEGAALTPTLMVMSIIGAFTALFAATIALAQNDIKRVLAYSTISQLGYMIAALGIGAYVAAAFHLVTHAFFKALLFLGSGSVIHGMEHGVLHTEGAHAGEGSHPEPRIDPQNMFNMGGLRTKMPVTFWTFLIGGFALSGFPLITAGFWSKDEILADAFAHNLPVFLTLALAALLTAFYTMRQITLTFLGEPRTDAAEHAQETTWTMTLPLVVLSIFAIGAGWVGVPEHFPGLGGLLPNWFHEFVGSTLAEHPEAVAFSIVPLLTSLVVALGGLFLGWLVYRNVTVGAVDPLEKALGPVYRFLQRKYYVDEIYNLFLVRPTNWIAETFVYKFLDRGVIDGILHGFASLFMPVGSALRNFIDKRVVNGIGDFVGEGIKWFGRRFRFIQTGRVQQYMIMALVFAFGALFYYLYAFLRP